MENNSKNGVKVESGQRMTFKIELKAKVDNIYDLDEIKDIKQSNLLICLKKMVKEFTEMTRNKPTSISLDSDLFYLARDEIQKETGKYQSSDSTEWNGIRIKGGCSLKDGDVVISSWNKSDIIIGS